MLEFFCDHKLARAGKSAASHCVYSLHRMMLLLVIFNDGKAVVIHTAYHISSRLSHEDSRYFIIIIV